MKNGIVIETNLEYHSDLSAISKSRLSKMSACPAYFKWCEENQEKKSADLIFGSAFHKWVLERETFYEEFAVIPVCDRRTKEGKALYEKFLFESEDKSIITEEEFETIKGMCASVENNKYAKALLNGERERSMYFLDDLTGVLCKVRPDCYKVTTSRKLLITDLKSCKSATPEDFMKDIVKYAYDLQSYMYEIGASKTLNIEMQDIIFCFICVEKKAPYLMAIYEITGDVLERGEMLFRKYIGQLKYCRETNNWYGYNGYTHEPMPLGLPDWANKTNKGGANDDQ